MSKRVCKQCGMSIKHKIHSAMFCNKKCKSLYYTKQKRAHIEEKACIICGTMFMPRSIRVVCCSWKCTAVRHKELMKQIHAKRKQAIHAQKNCIICGALFIPKSSRHITCSQACYQERERQVYSAKKAKPCNVDAKQSVQSDVDGKKRACMVCGEHFLPRNPLHIICSEACKARHKVWMKARLEAELYRERLMQSAALVGEDYG